MQINFNLDLTSQFTLYLFFSSYRIKLKIQLIYLVEMNINELHTPLIKLRDCS